MKHKASLNGLNWEVDSAGMGAWHIGEQPDRRSVLTARRHGIDISSQRARQFKPHDFDRFDLILAMDTSNYQEMMKLATSKEQKAKVRLIMDFVAPGRSQSVPDPYWNDHGFEQVFYMLDEACSKIIEHFEVQV